MEELSIKEKAGRYDDVVNKLKRFITQGVDPLITRADVQDFFPELKESEDEKVRKELIKETKGSEVRLFEIVTNEEFIAWLEKQGGQKPAWSEEDKKEIKRIIGLLEGWLSTFKETCYAEDCKCGIVWLKSIKDRVQPQPKQEWSDWDKTIIESIEALCSEKIESVVFQDVKEHANDIKDWLADLKERYAWKPSDGQMGALKEACGEHWEPDGLDPLYTLYQDLKKLKA